MQVRRGGRLYALKSIRKAPLSPPEVVRPVLTERNILMRLSHPFITRLHFAFQAATKFYLGLEYAPGGDMLRHMDEAGPPPVREIRLYVAELALTLEYLHGLGIVFRDLKPDNVLLDAGGHVTLATSDSRRTSRTPDPRRTSREMCGTPAYMTPEVVRGDAYGRAVDWWALGVLAFEMAAGTTPFFNRNERRVMEGIAAARAGRGPPREGAGPEARVRGRARAPVLRGHRLGARSREGRPASVRPGRTRRA